MGAGDLITKTIRHDDWDKGEQVVITELRYGDSVELTSVAMHDLSMGEMDDKEKIKAIKLGALDMALPTLALMEKCIVSWTLTKDGKIMKLNLENIKLISGRYGDYIADQIEELNPKRDDEFPDASGNSIQDGQGETST
jgi:hypothetical protein